MKKPVVRSTTPNPLPIPVCSYAKGPEFAFVEIAVVTTAADTSALIIFTFTNEAFSYSSLAKYHLLAQDAPVHDCGINRIYLSAVERAERNVSIDNIARIARASKSSLGG